MASLAVFKTRNLRTFFRRNIDGFRRFENCVLFLPLADVRPIFLILEMFNLGPQDFTMPLVDPLGGIRSLFPVVYKFLELLHWRKFDLIYFTRFSRFDSHALDFHKITST